MIKKMKLLGLILAGGLFPASAWAQYGDDGYSKDTVYQNQATLEQHCTQLYGENLEKRAHCRTAIYQCPRLTANNLDSTRDCQHKIISGATSATSQTHEAPSASAATLGDKCAESTTIAKNYCTDPLAYSTDDNIQIDSRENAGVASQLVVVAGVLSSGTGGGTRKLCSLMKNGGGALAGINGIFGGRCKAFISDCEKSCGEAIKSAGTNYKAQAEAESNLRLCKKQGEKAAEMMSAAGVNFVAGQMGKLCEDTVKTNEMIGQGFGIPEMQPIGADCGAGSTDPLCAGSGGGTGTSAASVYSSSEFGKAVPEFNVGDADLGFQQEPVTGSGGDFEGSKNPGVVNGGGQMLGGSGGQFGGEERGGRGQGSGYKTDVLQGERAGSGYSVEPGAGFASASGFSGYGSASDEEGKSTGFDLRKFLPGQDKAPLRGPAGLNRASAEVAPMHEDIFKKISDRLRVVCKTNRLKDCQ